MASIRFGAGIVDARGSVSGQTFSRNANGAYIRARTAPSQPRTPDQTANRQRFGAISSAYSSLAAAVAQAWVDAARGPLGQYTNRLGEVAQYTGQQLYNSVNGIRAAFGLAPASAPPPVASIPGVVVSDFEVEYDEATDTYSAEGTVSVEGGALSQFDLLVDVALSQSSSTRATSSVSYRRMLAATGVAQATVLERLMEAVDSYVPTPERTEGGTVFLRVQPAASTGGQALAPFFLVAPITVVPDEA